MTTYKHPLLFLLFFACYLFTNSQNEFSKWYFGYNAGLDFSTTPPTLLTNGALSTGEGCASISDNAGNLLFYTDGVTVYDKIHNTMANGTGLFGNTSTSQSAIIVKQPGNNNNYYIFTADANGGLNGGASYSIVDMSLAAGLGSVTVKNAPLYSPTCEKQVAVRHCNGRDVWIINHEYNSNNFRSYLLTGSALSSSYTTSSIGPITNNSNYSFAGQLKISPDGKKLAVTTLTSPNSNGGGFHLFDFDAATGVISNSLLLNNSTDRAYGIEFSSDGTKLFGSSWPPGSVIPANIYQWDICAASPSAIVASEYSFTINNQIMGTAQRGIDGKIYIAAWPVRSLSVINNPNASGAAMGFSLNMLSLGTKTSAVGLPNYINGYTRPAAQAFSSSLSCNSASFAATLPTFSSGCSTVPYPPSGYLWDFGEPSAGAANSSTLSKPGHSYAATGSYIVKLILFNACTNDTLTQTLTVSSMGPSVPVITGPVTVCKGERHVYTATGGSTYAWSNGITTASVALTPTGNTPVYTVSATTNGCTLAKSFTINVNPCLGIQYSTKEQQNIHIYPNPAENVLNIDYSLASTKLQNAKLQIVDVLGQTVKAEEITFENNLGQININELAAGVYFLSLKSGNLITVSYKFVKAR